MNLARTVHFTALVLVFCCLNLNAAKNIENFENGIDFSDQIVSVVCNKFNLTRDFGGILQIFLTQFANFVYLSKNRRYRRQTNSHIFR